MLRTLISTTVTICFTITPLQSVYATGDSTIDQIGTYDYLVQPNFTALGQMQEVTAGNTIGLGTFNNLDGEFVMVGGVGYRIPTTGIPEPITGKELTPFVQAIKFKPTKSGPIPPGTQCSQLIPAINELAQTDAGIVAVRVRGTFTQLTTRSVPAQSQPWPSLAQVVSNQTEFKLDGSRAVLVGFRQGNDYLGVGQPGLHLHGLTPTKKAGGHVLSCVVGNDAQLSIQRASSVNILNASSK
ncbi:MAG: acetolactate decarboxylase [Candidatus Nanopelagicales bacterium]